MFHPRHAACSSSSDSLLPGTTTAGQGSSFKHLDANTDASANLGEVASSDGDVGVATEFDQSLRRGHVAVQVAEKEEFHALPIISDDVLAQSPYATRIDPLGKPTMRRLILIFNLSVIAIGPAFAADKDGWIDLFNGKDFTGWVIDGPTESKDKSDGNKAKPLWTVQDGVIRTTGAAFGFLRYDKEFADFILHVEYRLVKEKGANSGIGIRTKKFEPSTRRRRDHRSTATRCNSSTMPTPNRTRERPGRYIATSPRPRQLTSRRRSGTRSRSNASVRRSASTSTGRTRWSSTSRPTRSSSRSR